MMDKKVFMIAVFPGDGIGPEVVREALKCLAVISETSGISFPDPSGAYRWGRNGCMRDPPAGFESGSCPGKRCRAARGRGRAEVGSAFL